MDKVFSEEVIHLLNEFTLCITALLYSITPQDGDWTVTELYHKDKSFFLNLMHWWCNMFVTIALSLSYHQAFPYTLTLLLNTLVIDCCVDKLGLVDGHKLQVHLEVLNLVTLISSQQLEGH